MKNKLILGCLMGFSIMTACDKNNNTNFDISTKTWKPALVDKNPASNPSGNVLYYALQDCEKDDKYNFYKNGILTISKGQHKCDNKENSTTNLAYTLNSENQKITIDGIEYTLAESSSRQLKYYAITANVSGYSNIVFLFE